MTRQMGQMEQINQDLSRMHLHPGHHQARQKDFGFITGLFKYKNAQFRAIGDQFIKYFRQRNPTDVCVHLTAIYEELTSIAHSTQRLIITYLIYRLKDLWKPEIVDKAEMFSHPYLLIFVKIYWNHVSPPATNAQDRSLLHFLGSFPRITPQEAYFVGRILTWPSHILKDVFSETPESIANNTIGIDQVINISPLKGFVEQQLRQFPFFEEIAQKTAGPLPPSQPFAAFNNQAMFPSLKQIIESLVPPFPVHKGHDLLNTSAQSLFPEARNQHQSRRTMINSAYGYFGNASTNNAFDTPPGIIGSNRPSSSSHHYIPPSTTNSTTNLASSLLQSFNSGDPAPMKTAIGKPPGFFEDLYAPDTNSADKSNSSDQTLESLIGLTTPIGRSTSGYASDQTLESLIGLTTTAMEPNHFSRQQQNQRSVASASPNIHSNASRADSQPRFFTAPSDQRQIPKPIGAPLSNQQQRKTSSALSSNRTPTPTQVEKIDEEMIENRTFALETLRKIVNGGGATMSKSHITKLLGILNNDKEILPMLEISVQDFEVIVESQPDLAAEILLQAHMANSQWLQKYLAVMLNIELSVQSMVAVSRFISSCERNTLRIPEDFLNSYITHCIQACENVNSNQHTNHRLVRMVCVFFSTLVRLNNFNIRPRIAEMQNFASAFSSVKETSQLYQAITQLMK